MKLSVYVAYAESMLSMHSQRPWKLWPNPAGNVGGTWGSWTLNIPSIEEYYVPNVATALTLHVPRDRTNKSEWMLGICYSTTALECMLLTYVFAGNTYT